MCVLLYRYILLFFFLEHLMLSQQSFPIISSPCLRYLTLWATHILSLIRRFQCPFISLCTVLQPVYLLWPFSIGHSCSSPP
ncbi:hypothetical protein EV361DRAFT_878818 [Lentinula raphanica]|nr:hypothetical protein EV361DRAFT_878818 [Lentinula raphanica]